MNKLFKLEHKMIDFIEKRYRLLFFIIITLIALYIRSVMIKFESGDYIYFLSGWFDQLKLAGGLKGLSNFPGDYNAPYMTIMAILTYLPFSKILLIKSVSIIFDFILAISSGVLAYKLSKGNKFIALSVYTVLLFLPNTLLNSAMWGQCDSIYTSFIILSIIFLFDEKYVLSFIMLGISFAFKLQFIFVLPVYIILYLTNKKYSIINFLFIPLMNIILCLPAIIAGNPIKNILKIYLNQTRTYSDRLVLNFPNIYNIINGNAEIISSVAKIFTIAAFGMLLFYVLSNKIKWNNKKILNLIILSVVICTYFLPSMHERYLFVGEILAVIYYFVYKEKGYMALTINLIAIITYSNYLFELNFEYMQLLSVAYFFIVIKYIKDTLKTLTEKKEKIS